MQGTRGNAPKTGNFWGNTNTAHVWALTGLLGLFCFRVVAQLVQAVHAVPFLPPFQSWQGSTLPYSVLLGSQIVIIVLFLWIIRRVAGSRLAPRRWHVRVMLASGAVYFTVMAFRLFAGLTFLTLNPWFAKPLPAFFHLVLASFIFVFGHHLRVRWRQQLENRP